MILDAAASRLATDVLVLAPTGRDAAIAERLLRDARFRARVCSSIAELCDAIDEHSGVLLIAEEALHHANGVALLQTLEGQPTWSDIPMIVLTGEGELTRSIPPALSQIAIRANVTLIERPVRIATLVTAVRSALRARMRQLDLRDYLVERQESELQLRAAREEADAANQAKSHFLTNMSHELRTPLNAIAGYTELLKLGIAGPINDDQRQHLERIERSERHLLSLINDVLNLARIEAGQVKLEMRDVDVAELVRGLEAFIAPQMQARSLRYTEHLPAALHARTDEEKVRQILLNLLSNAIKFTPEGGAISVSAERAGQRIEIRIEDSGEGISADKVEEIFEPFVQVGRAFNAPAAGTGLGLAISRDLAQRLGGDLTCTSTVGVGSVFTLSLPPGEDA